LQLAIISFVRKFRPIIVFIKSAPGLRVKSFSDFRFDVPKVSAKNETGLVDIRGRIFKQMPRQAYELES
jgi:hypothetical protein